MTDSAPVADDRDKLTHKNIPESLVARGRDSGGTIHLGEIKYLHRARDPYGNPLPDPPRFGDLLTPALDDLRVKDWHKLPPMGDKTTARYIAEIAHLPDVVRATEKAHEVDTRWKAIHGDYRKAVAHRDDWIRTTRTEIQVDANKGGAEHGITKAAADHLTALDAIVIAYERILGPVATQGASVGHLTAAPGANLQQSIIADAVADLSPADASRLMVACYWVNAHNAARQRMSMPPGDWPASTMEITGMLHGKGMRHAICWAREHTREENLQLQELSRQAGPWQQELTEGLVRSWMGFVDAAA